MVRRPLLAVMLAAVAAIAVAQPGSSARGRDGGILRIIVSPSLNLDHVDSALSFTTPGWALLEATCARLYSYPDRPSPASFRPQPEVAASYSVSRDFRTYTFRLRSGFRFSDGKPVRASAFGTAINRALQPFVDSPGTIYMRDIVGADDVLAGRTKTAVGVVARRNTLIVRFTRPAPDFLARTTLPFFCSVPPGLPASGEGAGAFASAGPYYVEEYRPNERIKIRRNPYYGGGRKVHLDGFDVDLRGGNPVEMLRSLDRGDADWGSMLSLAFVTPGLPDFEAKYGLNRERFFVKSGLTLRMLAFNSSRPLFRNNPRLRRAINFALDRRALLWAPGARRMAALTDQLLPHGLPGFRDANIYPLDGANLAKARKLARGRLRGRKAVLYTPAFALPTVQLAKEQLAKIGLKVEIKVQPEHFASAEYLAKLTSRGAEWDIALVLWTPNIPDAHAYLNLLLETQLQGGETLTRVRSRLARAELRHAARLPQGRARNRAYAEVDAMIARDVAPVAVLNVFKEATLVSDRVGCPVLRPALDLAVACLRK